MNALIDISCTVAIAEKHYRGAGIYRGDNPAFGYAQLTADMALNEEAILITDWKMAGAIMQNET